MTEKERLTALINRQERDRPACICPGGMMNMVTAALMEEAGAALPQAHSNAVEMAKLARAVYEQGCFENVGVPFCMTVEPEALGAPVDLGSSIHEPRVTGYILRSCEDWQSLRPMDLSKGRASVVLEALSLLREQCPTVPVIGNITGPISTASSLLEPMTFYRELRKKNAAAHAYLNAVTEQLAAFAVAQVKAGADIIAISDPSGTGEILGPKYFEEFALPALNRIIDAVKEAGAPCIVHICGQMTPVYGQVKQLRCPVLSFDSIVSMQEAKAQLPDHVLIGNVSTYTLEFGEPEKIATLAQLALKNGAEILAPACGLGMKTPLQNEQAMLRWLKEAYHADC